MIVFYILMFLIVMGIIRKNIKLEDLTGVTYVIYMIFIKIYNVMASVLVVPMYFLVFLMFWCLLTIISLYCVSLMSTDTFATYIAITIPFVVLQFIPKCVWKFIENCANSFSEYIIAPKVVLEKCSIIMRKKYLFYFLAIVLLIIDNYCKYNKVELFQNIFQKEIYSVVDDSILLFLAIDVFIEAIKNGIKESSNR